MKRLLVLLAALAGLSPCDPLDHAAWDALVKRYVTEGARVDYRRWKDNDTGTLDRYLATLAAAWPADLSTEQRKAASLNAYNALTVRWILTHYPVPSIWRTSKPFTAARHRLDGKTVSLDQIENGLRALGDSRIHAALVCAARSCPPLRREAYAAEKLDAQLDDNARAWLADRSLNRFLPDKGRAEVSSIFKWFQGDFERHGGSVKQFLVRFAPPGAAAMLARPDATIVHLDYHWGLNDATSLGADYGGLSFYWDQLRNRL